MGALGSEMASPWQLLPKHCMLQGAPEFCRPWDFDASLRQLDVMEFAQFLLVKLRPECTAGSWES